MILLLPSLLFPPLTFKSTRKCCCITPELDTADLPPSEAQTSTATTVSRGREAASAPAPQPFLTGHHPHTGGRGGKPVSNKPYLPPARSSRGGESRARTVRGLRTLCPQIRGDPRLTSSVRRGAGGHLDHAEQLRSNQPPLP